MKKLIVLLIVAVGASAFAQQNYDPRDGRDQGRDHGRDHGRDGRDYQSSQAEIQQMLRQISMSVRMNRLSYEQIEQAKDGLRHVLAIVNNFQPVEPPRPRLLCSKQSNGRFYPTNMQGQIVGSADWMASYGSLEDCRQSLPLPNEIITCFKEGNGRIYPANPMTGEVIGAADWMASYGDMTECKGNLPRPEERVSCFKQSNGRFYPSDARTGAIVGAADWMASYGSFNECEQTVRQ